MAIYNSTLPLGLTLALLAITSPHTVSAQSDDLDCSNSQTQTVMNRCAFLDFEAADLELNAIWPAARKANETFAQYLPENLKADANALLEAQRAWIKFRDAHCASIALPNAGGTIYPLIYNGCRAGVTRQRTEQLRQLVDNAQ